MDKIDLIVTKQLTDRLRERLDVGFLTEKFEEEYRAGLLTASEAEAVELRSAFKEVWDEANRGK